MEKLYNEKRSSKDNVDKPKLAKKAKVPPRRKNLKSNIQLETVEEKKESPRRSNRKPMPNLRHTNNESAALLNSNDKDVDQVEPTGNLQNNNDAADDSVAKENTKKNDQKKIHFHYEVDLTEMAERNTVNVANFTNYLRDQFRNKGQVNNLAKNVIVKQEDWKVIVKSEIFFKKSVIKYHAKKFLKNKKLRDWVKVVGNGNNDYRLTYYTPR